MSKDEKHKFFGHSKGARKNHVPKTRQPAPVLNRRLTELPANVDWRSTGIVSAVKDQGNHYCFTTHYFHELALIFH